MPSFSLGATRFDRYGSRRFLLCFVPGAKPIAAFETLGASSGAAGPTQPWFRLPAQETPRRVGPAKANRVTLERGIVYAPEFLAWAQASWMFNLGRAAASPTYPRRDIRIVLLDEAGRPTQGFRVHRCWVSGFQALPNLDANGNAVAIQHIELENEGWTTDTPVVEPQRAFGRK